MNEQTSSTGAAGSGALQVIGYWLIVGLPLGWGIYRTLLKLPALFH